MVSPHREALLNGTSAAGLRPKRKVWRVAISPKELVQLGFETAQDPWEQCIKPLLIAKGLPEGFTLDRTPAKWTTETDDDGAETIILEFE